MSAWGIKVNESFILELLFIYTVYIIYTFIKSESASFCYSQQTTKMEEKAKVKAGVWKCVLLYLSIMKLTVPLLFVYTKPSLLI